nr:mechanosensitive ion channel family protein [Vibrio lentus]
MLNDVSSLEQAHQTQDIAENEQEFLENILRRKNDHFGTHLSKNHARQSTKESASNLLLSQVELLQRLLNLSESKINTLAYDFRAASEEHRGSLFEQLQRRSTLMDTYYQQLMKTLVELEPHDIELDTAKLQFQQSLDERVNFLTNIILYKEAKILELEQRRTFMKDDDEALAKALELQNTEFEIVIHSFKSAIGIMDKLDVDTTDHLALLDQIKRHLQKDVLDVDVVYSFLEDTVVSFRLWLVDKAPSLFVRLLLCFTILFAARKIANIVATGVGMSVKSAKMNFSVLMQNFFTSIASKAVMFIGVLVALSQVGIELGPLLTGLGVAGVIIGFALQDTLSNFASGVMILIYRPYDVGDLVKVNDIQGTVNKMSLVSTTIQTVDNQRLVIPNNKIWGDVINNITAEHIRRIDMVFGIGYKDDIDKAKQLFMDILLADERVLPTPEPMVRVHSLNDSSVDFIVRPWVNTSDYWEVYWDMTEKVKKALDAEGISIPFPQQDVHLYTHNSN